MHASGMHAYTVTQALCMCCVCMLRVSIWCLEVMHNKYPVTMQKLTRFI